MTFTELLHTIHVLVGDDRADRVKVLTVSLRAAFASCRIEAAYSAQDLRDLAPRHDWDAVVVDARLTDVEPSRTISDLRRSLPNSAILLLGESADVEAALHVLKAGADHYVSRDSPGFQTEFTIGLKAGLERRLLRLRLERSEHYLRLIEGMTDVVYELDAEGRFLHISPAITTLLGYEPGELIGRSYSLLVDPQDLPMAQRHLNERRVGERATKTLMLRLTPKEPPAGAVSPVLAEVSASGLYGPHKQFLGTVGLIRGATSTAQERTRLRELEAKLVRFEEASAAMQRLQGENVRLREALQEVAAQSTALARDSEDMRLEARLHTLAALTGELSRQLAEVETAPVAQKEPSAPSSLPSAPQPVPPSAAPRPRPVTPAQEPVPAPPPLPPTPVPLERRKVPRLEVDLPTRFHADGSEWEGSTRDLSLGGAYSVFRHPIPLTEQQPVVITLGSETGFLELKGTVRSVREAEDRSGPPGSAPMFGVAMTFDPFKPFEEQILASMLQGLRERALAIQITVSTIDTGQPAGATAGEPAPSASPEKAAPFLGGEAEERVSPERRLTDRINLVMPVRIETCGPLLHVPSQAGRTVNYSAGGCCIRLPAQTGKTGLVGRRVRLRLAPPPALAPRSTKTDGMSLLGEVVWAAADLTVPSELREGDGRTTQRIGIRFVHPSRESEQLVADLALRALAAAEPAPQSPDAARVVTESLDCHNDLGQRVAVAHDRPRKPLPPGSPLVIIAPGFGESKRDHLALAYWFATNGFHVLRYDHTSHVGESDGMMEHTTLGAMRKDFLAVLSLAERSLPASPVAVFASNLAGRVVLKAAVSDPRIKLLVLLAPVVDVQATLRSACHEDLIATHRDGTRHGVINLLGFTVDADRWIGDAITGEYTDLRSTLTDAELVQAPAILYAAEQDPWVRIEQVKEVQGVLRSNVRQLYLLTDVPHRLRENPRTARAYLRQLVSCSVERFYPLAPKGKVDIPPARLINRQFQLERDRARVHHERPKAELIDFWQPYLDHVHKLSRTSEFWRLLDHVYRLLGIADKGSILLDAGCGNGDMGMLLLMNQAYRRRASGSQTGMIGRYVGVDLLPGAARQTQANLVGLANELSSRLPEAATRPVLRTSVQIADLDRPLPFRDGQFDRIVCNLTLGFLRDPAGALRELMRVLAPGGRIVLTVLQRHADLSPLLTNLMQRATTAEEAEEARWLWTHWGRAREDEANGLFRFFERHELTDLVKACGAPKPRIYTGLANQAFVLVAEKAVS